jgi:hypothetical protein
MYAFRVSARAACDCAIQSSIFLRSIALSVAPAAHTAGKFRAAIDRPISCLAACTVRRRISRRFCNRFSLLGGSNSGSRARACVCPNEKECGENDKQEDAQY